MQPSKLRLLAEEHANDGIDRATYRARRRALIEAIERGEDTIERAPRAQAPLLEPPTKRRAWLRAGPMLALAIGVLALGAAMLGRTSKDTSVQESSATLEVNAPRQQISAAHGLIEEFLTRRDFSAEALAAFTERWKSLSDGERTAAAKSNWFNGFAQSLSAEIRTQLALAEIGSTAPARERAERLRRFAQSVGVALDETAFDPPSDKQAESEVTARQNLGGAEWLAIQSSDQLTLQLFAVNALENVGRLMQRYGSVEMHVLKSAGGSPLYRVVHGSFDDVAKAKAAYAALPEDIRALSNGAIVKSIDALREDLSTQGADKVATEIDSQPESPSGASYTLQLFATTSAANARALVEAFPELALTATTVVDSASPHRVVLGRYATADDARAARQTLPPELLSRIGEPLVKQRESLGLP